MSAILRIQDGSPIWVSPSIVPSRDMVVSSLSGPQLATVQVNSSDVFVYVKVENPGTEDLGQCACTNLGAWTAPLPFQGFLDDPNGQASETKSGFTFTASPMGDSLARPGHTLLFGPLGMPPSPRRAWAWSPDGRFFAYVSALDSWLRVVAVQTIVHHDGTTMTAGQTLSIGLATGPGTSPWTNADFAWAGSSAVLASQPLWGAGTSVRLICPYAAQHFLSDFLPNTLSILGPVPWLQLVSPCASAIAFAPHNFGSAPQAFHLISTVAGALTSFRQNNLPIAAIASTGQSPSITTNTHTALGVAIDTGNGTTIDVDDPDCTFVGGGVVVRVDRVKASTLPSANLGVLPIGTAVLGALRQTGSSWVQVPNQNGWANQSEKHWCLLGQAYTSDLTTIPRPWNGQATNPPPFPTANDNCAQRNIEINP
jgi:hypothetical protein